MIEKKLNIFLNEDKFELLTNGLARKSKVFNQMSEIEYINFLENSNIFDEPEWVLILEALNISETYFYRDKNQIQLLESTILPKIIEKSKLTKIVSIWSAGCSSGEEVYTLAFLIQNLMPGNWKIQILGSDFNPNSIQKATLASYEDWSLRSVPENLKSKYFISNGKKFLVKQEYKKDVNFKLENFLVSNYFEEFDLVLCRNVLIYLNEKARNTALEKFASALKPEGFLLLGHSEGGLTISNQFSTEYNSNLIYYKKKVPPVNVSLEKSIPIQNKLEQSKTNSDPKIPSLSFNLLWQRAKSFADMGKLDLALNECLQILKLEPTNCEVLYFLAHIYESENKHQEAEKIYLKIIELDPDFLEAYLSLASFYFTSGRISDSKFIKSRALVRLENKDLQRKYESKGNSLETVRAFLADEKGIWIA
ncbi:MAG: hypothetical protein N3A69_00970 [Leptospiraceae bacterium]|nr:hypothetical protein [Leptospiraceae bacterium]